MATLNPSQIAQLAYNAGFRGSALRMAVSVALAESGGNTNAYNPESAAGTAPNHGSRGLWQIYGTAHPQYDNPQAFDPAINAQAAYQVYREAGNRFTPWSTFNNGSAYQISQNLNLDIPTGQIQFDPGTAPLTPRGLTTKQATQQLMPSLQTVITAPLQAMQEQANKPLVSFSLLPENITKAIESANPTYWKDTAIIFFLGLILLGMGGAILLALIAKPVVGTALHVGAEAIKEGAI